MLWGSSAGDFHNPFRSAYSALALALADSTSIRWTQSLKIRRQQEPELSKGYIDIIEQGLTRNHGLHEPQKEKERILHGILQAKTLKPTHPKHLLLQSLQTQVQNSSTHKFQFKPHYLDVKNPPANSHRRLASECLLGWQLLQCTSNGTHAEQEATFQDLSESKIEALASQSMSLRGPYSASRSPMLELGLYKAHTNFCHTQALRRTRANRPLSAPKLDTAPTTLAPLQSGTPYSRDPKYRAKY